MFRFCCKNKHVLPWLTVPLQLMFCLKGRASTNIFSSRLNQVNLKLVDRQVAGSDQSLLLTQVDEASQLRDVRPSDWAYEALLNLVERYGCISGFSDQTFRGEQIISRVEFASGLNSCLTKIEKLIAVTPEFPQADIDMMLRLMQEFQSDLAIIQGRTDGVQAELQDLEATHFSFTSKLKGEAVFALGDILSGSEDSNSVFGSRLRLDIATSFQGDDLLFTRFSSNNFPGFASETGSFQGGLAFADPEEPNFRLETLHYSFGLGDRLELILGATGMEADDLAPTISFLDGDGGSKAISEFGTRNPIYNPPGDAGLGISHQPVDELTISAGYLASAAADPNADQGLFNGPYSILGQIAVTPMASLSLAATYIHSQRQSDSETGTNLANLQALSQQLFNEEVPTVSNSYGLELSWSISDQIVIGGWGGLSKVSNLSSLNQQLDRGSQDIWNWAATLAIADLGNEGSLGGIVVGSEPRVSDSSINNLPEEQTKALHLEAFYQYQINDNLAVTPGVVWITEPEGNVEDSADLVIGTVRTTFSF